MNHIDDAKRSTVTFDFESLMNTLADMRDETVRVINETNENPHCINPRGQKIAWFYSQIGAYELAYQMGWITHSELRAFCTELHAIAQY